MANYNTPRTWTVGDAVTAARLNQDLRDNVAAVAEGGMGILLDNGYDDLEDGIAVYAIHFTVPVELKAISLLPGSSGSFQLDVRKCTKAQYSTANPSSDQSICGDCDFPELDSDMNYYTDDDLSDWTADIAKNDILRLYVLECTGIRNCFVSLEWTRK